jgi:tRNA(Ile)-lysidine synthase
LRQHLGREAAGVIRAHARRMAPGLFRLDPVFAATEPRDGAVYALRILLAAIGGVAHLPDEKRSALLFDRLSAKSFCATLSRTLVDARRTGIFMLREARGLPEPTPVRDGMIWDGRYRLSGAAEGLVVGPWANAREAKMAAAVENVPASLVRAAQAAEPVFRHRNGQIHEPARAFAIPLVAPWVRFLPAFDLEPAGAAAELVGAATPPAPPYAKHNVTGA